MLLPKAVEVMPWEAARCFSCVFEVGAEEVGTTGKMVYRGTRFW